MRMLRFEGATMRDAIAKVKAELGDHAVIISTRQVRRGLLGSAVEIAAAIDDGDAGHPARAQAAELGLAGPASHGGPTMGGPASYASYGGPTMGGPAASDRLRAAAPLAPPPPDVDKLLAPLKSELRSLRAMVRAAGDQRGTGELRAELAALRKLVEELAIDRRAELAPPAAGGLGRARTELAMPAASNHATLTAPSARRVIMLVGPTGAGKTTTIAKLAANAALVEHRRVRLITLDNYRVGGVDQIRTFADLIGVPLAVAGAPSQLAGLVGLAAPDELVLIDTAGKSPRDLGSVEELAEAIGELAQLEVHLVIPAASSAAAIDELVARYRPLGPARLLFTKLDEIDHAPELAHAPGRTRLPVTWVTTGQAVPEDIEQPSAARLLELARDGLASASATTAHAPTARRGAA
ncbi:MAG: flagellar biosynthesis protein FlhF [Kofleriaceae bacterium]